MLQSSVGQIRQEFDELIQKESNRLTRKIFATETHTYEGETEFDSSQRKLYHILEEWEEKFKGFAKDADDKSSGMTETLEKRLESEIGELDTKLKSLDISVQHHVRRREKVESLNSEVEKHEKYLAVQKSILEAQ